MLRRSVQGCVSSGRSRDRAFTPFCWFLAFSGWVPLAGAVPGLVCVLKSYGRAGSENKYCLLKPSETGGAVCGESEIYPDGDGNLQAKSQLCVKDVNIIQGPRAEFCRIHTYPSQMGLMLYE